MKHSTTATATRHGRRAAAFVATALVIKVAVLLQLWDHPLLQAHGELDTAYYLSLARRVAAEGVFADIGAFFVSPLYVYFLAAVFAAGGSVFAAQSIQVALGALAVGLLYASTTHWFGARAAAAAATLAILSGNFTFNEVLVLQSALDPFLVACALHALTRSIATANRAWFALTGTAIGLFALNRPNAVLYAVAVVAAMFVIAVRAKRPNRPRSPHAAPTLANASVLAASLLLVLGANALRNYAASGEAVLIASHGGLNFYIGNHARADGTYTPVPGVTPSIAGQAGDTTRVAEAALGRTLTAGEVSWYFAEQALDWIGAHPVAAARLTLRKAAILLNYVDVPLNHSYAFYVREPGSILRVLAVGPWLLLPFGIVGLLWPALRANRDGYWLWAMFVPVYGFSVVLFFVADRYRLPLFVPLCAASGAAIVRGVELIATRRLEHALSPAGALLGCSLLVFANLGLDNGVSGEQTRRAVWLVEQGAFEEAQRYVAEISGAHSHPGVLRFRVGQALLDAGRAAEAVTLLGEALAIDGPQSSIRLALGEALMRSGRAGDAVPHLAAAADNSDQASVAAPLLIRALVMAGRPDEALQRLPGIPTELAAGEAGADLALDFGTLALERRALDEAVRWLSVAVARAPNRAEAHEKLGLALFLGGDMQRALPYLEQAVKLDPASASAHLNLAILAAEMGRFHDARQLAARALRLEPGDARTVAFLNALPK